MELRYVSQRLLFISANLSVVLLLDEADVFLEERSLSDLERNSLVSGKFSPALLTDTNI